MASVSLGATGAAGTGVPATGHGEQATPGGNAAAAIAATRVALTLALALAFAPPSSTQIASSCVWPKSSAARRSTNAPSMTSSLAPLLASR